MKIRKDIEKQLIKDVQYELDEMDIDGMVKRLIKRKDVSDLVKSMIHEKIANIIQEKAFTKIKQVMPVIDAYTNEKVQEFLYSLGIKPF